MEKSEYYRMIQKITDEGYGWDAIKDITKIMEQGWVAHETVMREAVWERKVVRKVVRSDKTNKSKVEMLQDMLGGEEECMNIIK